MVGWLSSGTNYRDVHRQLQVLFHIEAKSFTTAYTTSPATVAVNARSRTFENICNGAAAAGGGGGGGGTPGARDGDAQREAKERTPIGDHDTTLDLYFCYPVSAGVGAFVDYVASLWGAESDFSPLDTFVLTRCAEVLCAQRKTLDPAAVIGGRRRAGELYRWDFRLWMVMTCEFYHVLSLMSDAKCLPGDLKKWCGAVAKASREDPRRPLTGAEARALSEVAVSAKQLKKNFLTLLRTEMGGAFSHVPGVAPEDTLAASAEALIAGALSYLPTAAPGGGTTNPYAGAGAPSPGGGGSKGKRHAAGGDAAEVPLVVFAEWLALRCCLSYSADEERETCYVPEEMAKRKRELVIPAAAAAEEPAATPPPSRPVSSSPGKDRPQSPTPKKAKPMQSSLAAWSAAADQYARTHADDCGSPIGAVKSAEGKEDGAAAAATPEQAAAVEQQMKRLFSALSEGTGGISREQAQANTYTAFGLDESQLPRKIHGRLSDGAFYHATGNRAPHITSTAGLAKYVRAYVLLFDTRKEALLMEEGDRPGGKRLKVSTERRQSLRALQQAIFDNDSAMLSNLCDLARSSEKERADLLGFVMTLPLRGGQARRRAQFFQFSKGQRFVLLSGKPSYVRGEGCSLDTFLSELYVKYLRLTLLGRVFPVLEDFAAVGARAMRHVAGRPANRDPGMEADRLYSKQYGAVLEYVAGFTVATLLHRQLRREPEQETVTADFLPHLREFMRDERQARRDALAQSAAPTSAAAGGDAASDRGATSAATADPAAAVATVSVGAAAAAVPEGDVPDPSLFAEGVPATEAARAYAEFRSDSRAPDDDAANIASGLPCTGSVSDGERRSALWRQMLELRERECGAQQTCTLDDESGEYVPTAVVAAVWHDALALHTVVPPYLLSPFSTFHTRGEFVRECVRMTNTAVGREDLIDREIHRRDLRFLLELAHLVVSTCDETREAVRETEGIARAQSSAWNVEDDARVTCTYSSKNFQKFFAVRVRRLCINTHAHGLATAELAKWSKTRAGARVDPVELALAVGAALVAYSNSLYNQACTRYLEELEIRNSALLRPEPRGAIQEHLPLPAPPPGDAEGDAKPTDSNATCHSNKSTDNAAPTGAKTVTYWERLRFMLPFGDSARQRELRKTLYEEMDLRKRGHLGVSDVYHGMIDGLQLKLFRKDILPVLYKALLATKKVNPGTKESAYYVTAKAEHAIYKREFKALLYYMYRYMEIFFMFDVLTCCGRLSPNLDVMPTADIAIVSDAEALAAAAAADPDSSSDILTAASSQLLQSAALLPFQLVAQAAGTPKEVTPEQLQTARALLRHWGVCIGYPSDDDDGGGPPLSAVSLPGELASPESVSPLWAASTLSGGSGFTNTNTSGGGGGGGTSEDGNTYLDAFALWASYYNLHPEGYGHGCHDGDPLLASIEALLIEAADAPPGPSTTTTTSGNTATTSKYDRLR